MNTQNPQSKPNRAAEIQQAIQLMEAGQLAEAEQSLREILAENEKEFLPWNVLGVVLKRQGRRDEAIPCFLNASKYNPKDYSPYSNLGNTYMDLGNALKAEEYYAKCVRLAPKVAEHHRLLALALRAQGNLKKALSSLQTAKTLAPKDSRIYIDIAGIYMSLQQFEEALQAIDKSIALDPENIRIKNNKSVVLLKMGRLQEAITFLEEVIAQHPNEVDPYIAMGIMYNYDFGDFEKANSYYERGYKVAPDNVRLLTRYCECLLNSRYGSEAGHIQHAYDIAKQVLARGNIPLEHVDTLQKVFLRTADFDSIEQLPSYEARMQYWMTNMNVGAMHNQLGRVRTLEDRHFMVQMHREWGRRSETGIAPIARPAIIQKHDKIRIGLMSSDLRDHPVTYFALPIIQYFNADLFELHCYSFYAKEADKVQQHIAEKVTGFHLMPGASDRAVAEKIAGDQIDILFELGGTTFLNKVQVCAHRPAPIQVSWLGYPHSVGLSRIDYILTDKYITPEDPSLLIEKPFELPNSWVVLGNIGFAPVPIDPKIPEDRNGCITFGTMNNPYKYTPEDIATWAKIMLQVPNSKFLFVRPEGGVSVFRDNIIKAFGQHGIAAERIQFIAKRGQHLPFYNAIDIALDPFPHTGGTTTCETLWMGVPCVTLVGPAFFERLSYSNLSNSGLGDLCAFTVEDYIKIAVQLAADKPRRQYLRQNLRPQIRNHPLGLQEQWVREFEAKIVETVNNHKGE